MKSIGIAPGVLMTLLAGGAEFFGGLALLIGGAGKGSVDSVISTKI